MYLLQNDRVCVYLNIVFVNEIACLHVFRLLVLKHAFTITKRGILQNCVAAAPDDFTPLIRILVTLHYP
jgi:hypothetical protein